MGKKVIPKGVKAFVPIRQLLLNEDAFVNADQMDPDRFLNDKSLERSSSFKPFGGGVTMCSGRNLARREVLAWLAIVLNRYDMEVLEEGRKSPGGIQGKPFPRPDIRHPSLGLMHIMHGDDMILRVQRKSA